MKKKKTTKTVQALAPYGFDKKTVKRFYDNIKKANADGCELWMGNTCKGYGTFSVKGKSYRAARLVYELYYGKKLPPTVDIHHHCKHKSCVAIKHLSPIPHGEHMKLTAGSGVWDGTKNSRSKLTEKQVIAIRKLRYRKKYSISKIHRRYPFVSVRSIYNCVQFKTYKFVDIKGVFWPDTPEEREDTKQTALRFYMKNGYSTLYYLTAGGEFPTGNDKEFYYAFHEKLAFEFKHIRDNFLLK